ncbi:hypothetical protein [Nostoc sp. LPT]|uniref:hypothetical protein n=1 Tax=Nostoc sp. LPT TaxID=2815387 RepID=UPI001E0256DB|nr:hypothetical protein [Nostoc sp. LPT]MBN4002193.1 hypothetical protein [Nostoc sp. LPT]
MSSVEIKPLVILMVALERLTESTSLTMMPESMAVVAFSIYARAETEPDVIVGRNPLL